MAAKRTAKARRQGTMTFRECASAYIAAQQAGWRDEREAKLWAASLRDHVYPVLGDLPVEIIDLPLVLRVIEPMWQTKTTTASRLRRRVEAVLDWATVRGYRQGENPARWKGLLDQVLPKERKVARVEHHEALPYAETAAFMAELRSQATTTARALEFAILTATRVGEVIGARWAEIDFQGRVWAIPAERMKAAREHRVPLSDAAVALLEALPRTSARIFPVSRTSVWYAAKRLRPEITVHGFRSSFRDWAGERTSYAREVIEQCLAHAAGDQTELAYRRGDALEKRRRVMEDWATFCAQPAPASDNVRPIRVAG
jgi:integrase